MVALDEPRNRTPVFVTYGRMRSTGFFRHSLDDYRGDQKVVVQTDRGIEIGAITIAHCTVCPASDKCGKPGNTARKEREQTPIGRILRPATPDDVSESDRLTVQDREIRDFVRKKVEERKLGAMKVVDAERLFGGDRIVVYFSSEVRIDFRDLVKELAREFQTRIEMRQIGARDEAKLLGEGYGRCGETLCCQTFLQDLKPVPMRMAKTQKATLDPNKVSGRCGRLMCCLRFEDNTYEELRHKLPQRGARVKTPDGVGTVVDTQILTQLVMVQIDGKGRVAFGLESLEVEGSTGASCGTGPTDSGEHHEEHGHGEHEHEHEHGPETAVADSHTGDEPVNLVADPSGAAPALPAEPPPAAEGDEALRKRAGNFRSKGPRDDTRRENSPRDNPTREAPPRRDDTRRDNPPRENGPRDNPPRENGPRGESRRPSDRPGQRPREDRPADDRGNRPREDRPREDRPNRERPAENRRSEVPPAPEDELTTGDFRTDESSPPSNPGREPTSEPRPSGAVDPEVPSPEADEAEGEPGGRPAERSGAPRGRRRGRRGSRRPPQGGTDEGRRPDNGPGPSGPAPAGPGPQTPLAPFEV